MMCLAVTDLIC